MKSSNHQTRKNAIIKALIWTLVPMLIAVLSVHWFYRMQLNEMDILQKENTLMKDSMLAESITQDSIFRISAAISQSFDDLGSADKAFADNLQQYSAEMPPNRPEYLNQVKGIEQNIGQAISRIRTLAEASKTREIYLELADNFSMMLYHKEAIRANLISAMVPDGPNENDATISVLRMQVLDLQGNVNRLEMTAQQKELRITLLKNSIQERDEWLQEEREKHQKLIDTVHQIVYRKGSYRHKGKNAKEKIADLRPIIDGLKANNGFSIVSDVVVGQQ